MRQKHLLLLILLPLGLFAQKKEEGFDINFKPTQQMARYYVITEAKEGKWHREAFYLPEKTQAMEGWSDITPLTNFGFGMESEVVRLLKKSPPWSPAIQFGKIVDSYKKQPVTFVVAGR